MNPTERWYDLFVPWCQECGDTFKQLKAASLHDHWQDIVFTPLSTLGEAARGIVLLIQPINWRVLR